MEIEVQILRTLDITGKDVAPEVRVRAMGSDVDPDELARIYNLIVKKVSV